MKASVFAILLLVLVLAVGLPAAADGYAQCGSGGYGYTATDLAGGWHTHHFGPSHIQVEGYGFVRINHGWQTGSNWWYFTGASYGIESGTCIQ